MGQSWGVCVCVLVYVCMYICVNKYVYAHTDVPDKTCFACISYVFIDAGIFQSFCKWAVNPTP